MTTPFEREFNLPVLYEYAGTAIIHINDLILHGRDSKRGIRDILQNLVAHAPGLEILSTIGLPNNLELSAPYAFCGQAIIYMGCVLHRGWRISVINYTLPHQDRMYDREECSIKNRCELSEFERYLKYLQDNEVPPNSPDAARDDTIIKFIEAKGTPKPIGEVNPLYNGREPNLECDERDGDEVFL